MSAAAAKGGGTPARDALEGALTALRAANVDSPRLDAELLVAHALGVPRERLHTDSGLTVAGPAVHFLREAVRRRAVEREPLAYILGRRHFRTIELAVDARALIPRPETELLVEVALDLEAGASVLDLGTGSGAVALALAAERPDLAVTGSDRSAAALSLARENATRLGVGVDLVQADMLEGIGDDYDALLANLPYIAEAERAMLAPEILRHEPPDALFAGADGLDAFRALAAALPRMRRLRLVALEVGAGQAPAVAALLAGAGLPGAQALADLAGIERVVAARRP